MARSGRAIGINERGTPLARRMNTAVCIRHDVERELRRVDWADVGIRLTAYATWKARNLHWRTGRTDALAAGKTPEDIAAEAILKVLGGERAGRTTVGRGEK